MHIVCFYVSITALKERIYFRNTVYKNIKCLKCITCFGIRTFKNNTAHEESYEVFIFQILN